MSASKEAEVQMEFDLMGFVLDFAREKKDWRVFY